jgi:hypothetical protein
VLLLPEQALPRNKVDLDADTIRVLEQRGIVAGREHATEVDLTERYFKGREDGMAPGIPLRVLTAESE